MTCGGGHRGAQQRAKMTINTWKPEDTPHKKCQVDEVPEQTRQPIKEAKAATERAEAQADMQVATPDSREKTRILLSKEKGRILDVRNLSEMEVKLLLKDSVLALVRENSSNTTTLRNIDVLIVTGYGNGFNHASQVFNSMGIEISTVEGNAGRLFLAGEEIEAYAIRKANEASIQNLRRSLMIRGSLLATMVLGPTFVAPSLLGIMNGI